MQSWRPGTYLQSMNATKCHALWLTQVQFNKFVGFQTKITVNAYYSLNQKRTSRNKSVDILQQLVTTSRYQDTFAWLATTCDNQSFTSCQQTCCKLIISTGLLQVVSTSCNKSANDKMQQA